MTLRKNAINQFVPEKTDLAACSEIWESGMSEELSLFAGILSITQVTLFSEIPCISTVSSMDTVIWVSYVFHSNYDHSTP